VWTVVPFVELSVTAMATGGEALGRDDGGRVVFVSGALPGERVRAELTAEKRDFARATVTDVLEASPDRIAPPCPHVAEGCGGCGWQHIDPAAQPGFKRDIVVDALRRQGRVEDAEGRVGLGPSLPALGHRTTVRAAVVGGRAGFRRHHSHEVLAVDDCLVAHPLVSELIVDGWFADATEVTLRAGARTGDRLVLAHPTAAGIRVPDGVLLVGSDEVAAGRRAWHHEEVGGRRWRISATSFFQARPDGADVLVDLVAAGVDALAPGAATLVDLCSGVGLFAGTAGAGRHVVAVERHRPATADAAHNLAGLDVRIIRAAMEGWRPSSADVVVADPARSGLGPAGVAAVAATHAPALVLVSCDPASLGRDTKLLADCGYRFDGATVVDLFPHTPHVEVVSRFRTGPEGPSAPTATVRSKKSHPRGRRAPKSRARKP
jgi:23S rRNA (uracil1939-C5)-methyltransferase